MTVLLRGAAQVLRLPDEPYLRHDRASELTLEPGDLTVPGAAGAVAIDASGCAVASTVRSPGSSASSPARSWRR